MNISLIICSRDTDIPLSLRKNVSQTIFTNNDNSFEFIVIDNHDNRYNIFEAYNTGVRRATGDILCFMHDDIEYQTIGWGDMVVSLFTNPDIDACAVIGSTYLRKAPSYTNHGKYSCMNMIYEGNHTSINADKICPLIVFDGFWFCVRKRCFKKVRFDEETYGGFHFYDMDIAIQLHRAGYHTVFIPDILIFHPYGANFNNIWLENSFSFYYKWKDILPISSNNSFPSIKEQRSFNLQALYSTLRQIIMFKRWDLFHEYCTMAREVMLAPAALVILSVIGHHFFKKSM